MIVTNHELPTPARLSEPFIRRPSNPLDGIFTRLENHDLVSLFFHPQGLSPSPWLEPLLKKRTKLSDRTPGLLFKEILFRLEVLRRRASVDLDKHLSMHPALRTQHLTGSHPHALSRIGETRFTGCVGSYQLASAQFSYWG